MNAVRRLESHMHIAGDSSRWAKNQTGEAERGVTMYRLSRLNVAHFRGVRSANINAEGADVVLLTGRIGAGKTSVLQALTFLLDGGVSGLTQADYRPDNNNNETVVEAVFTSLTGPDVHIKRQLGSGHSLYIDGGKCKLQDSQRQIYAALGISTVDIGPLLDAQRFITQSPGDQAEYLLEVVGSGVVSDGGVDLVSAVAQSTGDSRQLSIAEEIAVSIGGSGVEFIEPAVEAAKTCRLDLKRDLDRLDAERTVARGHVEKLLADLELSGVDKLDDFDEANEAAMMHILEDQAVINRRVVEVATQRARVASLKEEIGRRETQLAEVTEQAKDVTSDVVAHGIRRHAAEKRLEEAQIANAEAAEKVQAKVAEEERVLGIAERKLEWAQAKHASVSVELKEAEERQAELEVLSDVHECPTCGQVLDIEHLVAIVKQIDFLVVDYTTQAEKTNEQCELRRGVVSATRRILDELRDKPMGPASVEVVEARDALNAIPSPPDVNSLNAQVASARTAFTERVAELENLERVLGDDADGPVTSGNNAGTLEDLTLQAGKVKSARDLVRDLDRLDATVQTAEAERDHYSALIAFWPGIASQAVETGLGPLLDDVAEILIPICGWKPVWTSDGIFVQGVGFQRSFAQLSDGERLVVGAAWQVALAQRIGFGLALMDNAPLIDDETFGDFLGQVAEMAAVNGIAFLMATAPLSPECVVPVNVAVVQIEEGQVIS